MSVTSIDSGTTEHHTILDLVLPDWAALDTVRRSPLPFALWTVGNQCLLHHWLDHAVNDGIPKVRVFVVDRPAEVRHLLEGSTLWPIKTEAITISSSADAPDGAIPADHLPGFPSPPPPQNGWDLLDRLAALEETWLEQLHTDPMGDLLSVGSSCRIHPEAKLIPPYFIGDEVLIGPGCELGPFAVIGKGSLIAGANHITHSHLSPHSYLGPVTALINCLLESGALINLRNRARIDEIEPHLVSDLTLTRPIIPFRDRLFALKLYLLSKANVSEEETFTSFDGREFPSTPSPGLAARRSWLPLVWKGKLPLFGILPRSKEQYEELTPDWRQIIRHATVGVFSYADCLGCHSPEDPDEALHAVYQASLPPGTLRASMLDFIRRLKPSDLSPS